MLKSTRNQIGNARNPFQGLDKRVLCVCSAGLLRSPTLANELYKSCGFNTRACGSSQDFALIPISEALVAWADEIVFVNQDNYEEAFPKGYKGEAKVKVLNITDSYDYADPELRALLIEAYEEEPYM